ncbi:SRPBCC domain-containing protein [Nocardioides sp. LS1]|uniref:SRPBCC domain-containing protein n=1 Tax=Nocardioides sp. LS1 TaxID=1027620 RepID=UPI000F6229B5|nr:SRPBCC domain-containing protein [Nocardioides sp. LS1]GCD89242.1 hypothetical protein NLS1_12480 [Nocardioides sp. LS1]
MRTEHTSRLTVDNNQFVICDADADEDLVLPASEANSLVAHDVGVAMFVSVISGGYDGQVNVTTVAYGDEPPLMRNWEDVVEVSVRCATGLIVGELMEGGLIPLVEGGGDYRLRVSARGRDLAAARDLEDDDEVDIDRVVEDFLIEAWPSPPAPMRVLRADSRLSRPDERVELTANERMLEGAAMAACVAIGRDIDREVGARTLSGATSRVDVEASLVGKRSRYFKLFAHLHGWWGASSPGGELAVGGQFWLRRRDDRPEHAIMGSRSAASIECTWLEIRRPSHVAMTWSWLCPADGVARPTWGDLVPVFSQPTRLTFDLVEGGSGDNARTTAVRVTHEGVPREWEQDLVVYWAYKLADAERVYALNYRD